MGYGGTMRPKNLISSLLGQTPVKTKSLAISNPHDFRQVRDELTLMFDDSSSEYFSLPSRSDAIGLTNHRC